MRNRVLYNAIYNKVVERVVEIIREEIKDDSMLLEFLVYCAEKLKDRMPMRYFSKKLLNKYADLLIELSKLTEVPMFIDLDNQSYVPNLIFILPHDDCKEQMYEYINYIRHRVNNNSEEFQKKVVYGLYLEELCRAMVKFANALWRHANLNVVLDNGRELVILEGLKTVFTYDIHASRSLTKARKYLVVSKIANHHEIYGIPNPYGFAVDVRILSRRYDILKRFDEEVAKQVALAIALS